MEGKKGRVCVTGGTGFFGSWIIKTLLEHGYFVNNTVRFDPERKRDLKFLTNLPGASEKLQIFNADLSNPDSFGALVEGCIGVFHVATPIDFQAKEPEEVVTKRTIDGALRLLKICLDAKTVKRVVYTSGDSAVINNGIEDEAMDESFWSDVDFLRTCKPYAWPYAVSKTLTEKAVLEFGEQNGLELRESTNYDDAGNKEDHGMLLRPHLVHVDDVARAHIFLLEHSNPKGRYNCSPCLMTIEEMHELLSANFSEFQIPTLEQRKWNSADGDLKKSIFLQLIEKHNLYKESGFSFNELEKLLNRRCLLLWHIATDICYECDPNGKDQNAEASKKLSDYMLYILLIRPFMLPKWIDRSVPVRDTFTEAIAVFHRRKFSVEKREDACIMMLQLHAQCQPLESQRREKSSESVFLEGCRLGAQLQQLNYPWEMICQVWMEMVTYAASHCEWQAHGQQHRRGELLTHVCLVMAELGLSDQFELGRQGGAAETKDVGWGWARSKITPCNLSDMKI
ncbi:hypothetical protein L6164_003707 [Bauhinia variegata]|uniref:Uncharacterized protein n=1 Tax=Bauhinia variegata TaxID=167791 RepID=A0ACB9Q1N9_BAUVA|nr:hypothetical protein L6164_003707 [Bauhinia variegata]